MVPTEFEWWSCLPSLPNFLLLCESPINSFWLVFRFTNSLPPSVRLSTPFLCILSTYNATPFYICAIYCVSLGFRRWFSLCPAECLCVIRIIFVVRLSGRERQSSRDWLVVDRLTNALLAQQQQHANMTHLLVRTYVVESFFLLTFSTPFIPVICVRCTQGAVWRTDIVVVPQQPDKLFSSSWVGC